MKGLLRMVKSPDRLAMEVRGKSVDAAFAHLLRYGLSEDEAGEVVFPYNGQGINGTVSEIAEGIRDALKTTEILSGHQIPVWWWKEVAV